MYAKEQNIYIHVVLSTVLEHISSTQTDATRIYITLHKDRHAPRESLFAAAGHEIQGFQFSRHEYSKFDVL